MPGRPTKPKSPRGPAAIAELQRDNEALSMRANGVNLRDIAEHFGFNHPQQAARLVDRAMARVPRENAIKLRAIWDERHERAAKRMLEVMEKDHFAVSHGSVVKDFHGNPVLDYMPNVAAAKALMDVSKRAAALGGLDAPSRRSVEVVTQTAVEREIARLEAELSVNDLRGVTREHPPTS